MRCKKKLLLLLSFDLKFTTIAIKTNVQCLHLFYNLYSIVYRYLYPNASIKITMINSKKKTTEKQITNRQFYDKR